MSVFYNSLREAQTWHTSSRRNANLGKNRLRNVRVCGRGEYLFPRGHLFKDLFNTKGDNKKRKTL